MADRGGRGGSRRVRRRSRGRSPQDQVPAVATHPPVVPAVGQHPPVVPTAAQHPPVVPRVGPHPPLVPQVAPHPNIVPKVAPDPVVVPPPHPAVAAHTAAGARGKRKDEDYESGADTRKQRKQKAIVLPGGSHGPAHPHTIAPLSLLLPQYPQERPQATPPQAPAPLAPGLPFARPLSGPKLPLPALRRQAALAASVAKATMAPKVAKQVELRSKLKSDYSAKQTKRLHEEAKRLHEIPLCNPAHVDINYGHRKWPISLLPSLDMYITYQVARYWPPSLVWARDTHYTERARRLVLEFQVLGLPYTVHCDIRHEKSGIPIAGVSNPAYKCQCWNMLLGEEWFNHSDATLIQALGPDWGLENQHLLIHLVKRLLTGMTMAYVNDSPEFFQFNPTYIPTRRTRRQNWWHQDCLLTLEKVLELRGVDRVAGRNWNLRNPERSLVGHLTGLPYKEVTAQLRRMKHFRPSAPSGPYNADIIVGAIFAGPGPGPAPDPEAEGEMKNAEDDHETEGGMKNGVDDLWADVYPDPMEVETIEAQPQAPPAPPAERFVLTPQEERFWDSYLLRQRLRNPEFVFKKIPVEVKKDFIDNVYTDRAKPALLNWRIQCYAEAFLDLSPTATATRGPRLQAEAVAAYNQVARSVGAEDYDIVNPRNNVESFCDVASDITLQLFNQRRDQIQAAVIAPNDFEARGEAALADEMELAALLAFDEIKDIQAAIKLSMEQGTAMEIEMINKEKLTMDELLEKFLMDGLLASSPGRASAQILAFKQEIYKEKGKAKVEGSPTNQPTNVSPHGEGGSNPMPHHVTSPEEVQQVREQLLVGPHSVAAQYEPLLRERLEDPNLQDLPCVGEFLRLSPSHCPAKDVKQQGGQQAGTTEHQHRKGLPVIENIVAEHEAEHERTQNLKDGGWDDLGGGGGGGGGGGDDGGGGGGGGGGFGGGDGPGPEDIEWRGIDFLMVYESLACSHPDVLPLIRWPSRFVLFHEWVSERWPEMYYFVLWPRPVAKAPPTGAWDNEVFDSYIAGGGVVAEPHTNISDNEIQMAESQVDLIDHEAAMAHQQMNAFDNAAAMAHQQTNVFDNGGGVNSNSDQSWTKIFNQSVEELSADTIDSLEPGGMIMSDALNLFMTHLFYKFFDGPLLNGWHFVDTFWYEIIHGLMKDSSEKAIKKLKRMGKSMAPAITNWHTVRYIVIPIHVDSGDFHWTLVLIRMIHAEKCICVYHMDSLNGLHPWDNITNDLSSWLQLVVPLDGYTIHRQSRKVLQQVNHFDCGIHVLYMIQKMVENQILLDGVLDHNLLDTWGEIPNIDTLRTQIGEYVSRYAQKQLEDYQHFGQFGS